jgi:hypothetical protein
LKSTNCRVEIFSEQNNMSSAKSTRQFNSTRTIPPSFKDRTANFTDDIVCGDWLDEVGMGQYIETFTVNFSVGGNLLSRKRLSTVRLQDFSKMNIENFVHQKILFNHIRHTLQYSFMNPERQASFSMTFGNDTSRLVRGRSGLSPAAVRESD